MSKRSLNLDFGQHLRDAILRPMIKKGADGVHDSVQVGIFLRNGHSRICRGESHFSRKWPLASVGKSGESAQHGLVDVGESGESQHQHKTRPRVLAQVLATFAKFAVEWPLLKFFSFRKLTTWKTSIDASF
jgi:hypothetical protein